MNSMMCRTREGAIAASGDGLIEDPISPELLKLSERTERRVRTLELEIRASCINTPSPIIGASV